MCIERILILCFVVKYLSSTPERPRSTKSHFSHRYCTEHWYELRAEVPRSNSLPQVATPDIT